VESFYQKALAYFQQELYEEAISFIEHEIEVNRLLYDNPGRMVEIYHLLAESYFWTGDYRNAVATYQRLFEIGGEDNMIIVRDYAIALINNDEIGRAYNVLERAIEDGMGEDFIYYIRGEIAYVDEDLDSAIADFTQSIAMTDDSTLQVRAYLMLSRIYEEMGERQMERLILMEAVDEVPIGQRHPLLQRLAQVNIDLGQETQEHSYFVDAIEVLQLIVDRYRATFTTYNNIVVLSKEIGDFITADTTLDTMEELFGESYIIYMRRAFMEIDIQEQKSISQRYYTRFLHYYNLATELYEEHLRSNDTDFEMAELEIVYWQIHAGGWFD
jgi:tetratricopeptide (TPR) repeat protein